MSSNLEAQKSPPRSAPAKLDAVPVFYTPLMAAENDSFSPSAAKPRAAVESWLKLNMPVHVIAPERKCLAAAQEALELVKAVKLIHQPYCCDFYPGLLSE
jgi:hypothetical protein